MLLAFGSNGSGQLGLGHLEDVTRPQPSLRGNEASTTTSGQNQVKRIVAGGNHTLVLCHTGQVHATGNNDDGCCDLDGLRTINCADISASWSASFFIHADRKQVLVCGSGEHGTLGLGEGIVTAERMQTIAFPPLNGTIEHIASCITHSLVVLSNGEVWGWGRGRKGQLGAPSEDVWTPRRLSEVAFFATKAVCGRDFSCIVGKQESGEILLLGPDTNDRFGLKSGTPQVVRGWKDIEASWGSIFVLMEDGSVSAWGRNDRGQLPPCGLPPIKAIAAGSEHCLAITATGQVLAWGWGEHGNCGLPTDEHGVVKGRWNEVVLSNSAEHIFAGCATSFIVVKYS